MKCAVAVHSVGWHIVEGGIKAAHSDFYLLTYLLTHSMEQGPS